MVYNRGGVVGGGAEVAGWASGGDNDYDMENKKRLAHQVHKLQDEVRNKDEEIPISARVCAT